MKTKNKFIVVILLLIAASLVIMIGMQRTEAAPEINDLCRYRCIIETIRYTGPDSRPTYDTWVTSSISIDRDNQFITFFPLEGEYAGKQHVIPFSNIHIIREL